MKTKIIGVIAICLVLIGVVFAFGPHTRLDRNGQDCVYYYGPGSSCLVPAYNCNADGSNRYVMFDETECIAQPTEKKAAEPEPEEKEEVPPAMPAEEPVAAQPTEIVEYKSYLWLLIPMLLIFAVAVILLLLWLDTRGKYTQTQTKLSKTRKQKRKLKGALKKEKRKKDRAYCPIDGKAMRKSGSIKQGPRGGQRQMYVCPECGHRTMKTVKP